MSATTHAVGASRLIRSSHVRRAGAAFVAAVGLADLAGAADVFSKASQHRSGQWLGGNWQLWNPRVLRIFGVLWAAVTIAYFVTAAAIWSNRRCWPSALSAVGPVSLGLLTVVLLASFIGVLIDVALLLVAGQARTRRNIGTDAPLMAPRPAALTVALSNRFQQGGLTCSAKSS